MVSANLIYWLGRAGASEEYVKAVMAGDVDGARNHFRKAAESMYDAFGAVYPPESSALVELWNGNVEEAYRAAGANEAILMEAVFSPPQLGLEVSSDNYNTAFEVTTT